jgi:hypothetical protein
MARELKARTGKVSIAEPSHLCGVQAKTRELCRAAGFSEPAVFQAVIAVTEFAYGLFLKSSRVELKLSAVRRGRSDELLAENPEGRAMIRVGFPHA